MKFLITLVILLHAAAYCHAQAFTRSELPTILSTPWEMTYGPDHYLWVSDSGGRVSRINPTNGNSIVVYSAPDYFPGSTSEQLGLCFHPNIGAGTLGLALHPDFNDTATAYIYFIYSYNSGTDSLPATMFKLKRLKWDANENSVVSDTDIVTRISTGYDHLGGRLIAVKRNGTPYLFLSVGDHGISEINSPSCYQPQSENPNNFAQDPTTDNGKIHRYNMDGSIPVDNPISRNSFYTRGHRNPQGLMYNPSLNILYDIEHGDRTDDEINILYPGKNYGWKNVRGYHWDQNFPGEKEFIENYTPDPRIAHDSLIGAFYSWCATTADTSSDYLNWCTVAPSDGIYYGSTGIPQWTNSLLVTTLKDGYNTDAQVYQFKLQSTGQLVASTSAHPNPSRFFASDQRLNGRLRDIAVSHDGLKIFLINNYGAPTDKITVYSYDSTLTRSDDISDLRNLSVYPNPAISEINVSFTNTSLQDINIKLINTNGISVYSQNQKLYKGEQMINIPIDQIADGVYQLVLNEHKSILYSKRISIIKE